MDFFFAHSIASSISAMVPQGVKNLVARTCAILSQCVAREGYTSGDSPVISRPLVTASSR